MRLRTCSPLSHRAPLAPRTPRTPRAAAARVSVVAFVALASFVGVTGCGGGSSPPATASAASAADSGAESFGEVHPADLAELQAGGAGGSGASAAPGGASSASPAPPPAPAPAASPEPQDECTPVGVDFEKRARPKVKDCYAAGKKKDPNLQGTVKITVDIDTLGKVKAIKIAEKTLPDPVAQCMLKAVKTTPLPDASKCPGKSFTLPITFPTPP